MTGEIRDALAPLHGMPLWRAGRAATMLWLSFGRRVHAPTLRHPERITGEYALHLQCPWRVSGPNGVVTGSADMFVPSDPDMPAWAFDAECPGNALADFALGRWIDCYVRQPLVVIGIDVDRCGGFCLALSEGFAFEAFPNSRADGAESEYWRLLKPAEETRHFVMRGLKTTLE
jgi:hypothetical protein